LPIEPFCLNTLLNNFGKRRIHRKLGSSTLVAGKDIEILQQPQPAQPRGMILILAMTIFVSAFLLFQVQPLISKLILPWFGGSPAVWTTAMLFFQSVLFAGYAYAHLTSRLFPRRQQTLIHIGLLVLASSVAWLIIPGESMKPSGGENPTWRILILLGVCVGLPYFTLATTGPLIQAWFSLAYPGRSPYRLYSLSNLGSLLALLSFPYAFEPYLRLRTMGYLWMAGFWVFAAGCFVAAMQILRLKVTEKEGEHRLPNVEHGIEVDRYREETPKSWERLSWVFLPFVASMMFIATTDHVSHDVAPEPRLWITTLSLYLLTFIIVFDHERWYRREIIAPLCIATIVFLTLEGETSWLESVVELSMSQSRWLHFLTMFLICLVCHGELARLRPKSHRYLTEFYLGMSAGGACGGLFISLIATNYFADYYEWTLALIIAVLVCAAIITSLATIKSTWRKPVIWACSMLLILFLGYCHDPFSWNVSGSEEFDRKNLQIARNFYGTIQVVERVHRTEPKESFRVFYSGSIKHGMQFTHPDRRRVPTSYYSEQSGCGETFAYACRKYPQLRVAAVGLGVGTLARYARPTDHYDFFEINPLVIDIAREHFWFLRECQASNVRNGVLPIVLGDARLQLESLSDDVKYDVIVLDAFSGDSVPVHLLTEEAFGVCMRHLKPQGLLVVHITNTYLNLFPVVKRQAEHLADLDRQSGVVPAIGFRHKYDVGNVDRLIYRSHYFVLTRDEEYLREYPSVGAPKYENDDDNLAVVGEQEHDNPAIFRWTDDFSSINDIEIR
jgi:hypothetical protein